MNPPKGRKEDLNSLLKAYLISDTRLLVKYTRHYLGISLRESYNIWNLAKK